ncbi:MAG: acetolactate synthase large subunit [Gammaproteobacteria bacterium]|nr:acetolactate synthase large subunit [Gammaproteobacteria bacterium]
MNGADRLISSLISCGVDTCFANPGTSEMHMVQAIDRSEDFHAILCLFEGVCTGAADGFGRMRGRPASTLLHLGAGLGNGIANLHNCRRAATPLLNIVGDHAIHHVAYDAPLTSDIEAVAKPVSSWIRTSRSSTSMDLDVWDAVQSTLSNHPDSLGNISTLIVPADCAWSESTERSLPPITQNLVAADPAKVEQVAQVIDSDTMILVDGNGLTEEGVKSAGRIAKKTGCRVFTPTFPARVESGPDLPLIHRLPYFPEQIIELLQPVQKLVLCGGAAPVSFFAYPSLPSHLVPDHCAVLQLAHRHEDVATTLQNLADSLGAKDYDPANGTRPEVPTSGETSVRSVATMLAARIPDDAIITGDSGGGGAAFPLMQRTVGHTWLNLTGGSIGDGGPVGVGAAVACPDRPVFALLGDGGAMYTNQFLWTAARENLNLTTVIFSNQQYNILEVEYLRTGVNEIGKRAASLFDLSNPQLDWVKLAEAQGVPAMRASSCEQFIDGLDASNSTDGPFLIEAMV